MIKNFIVSALAFVSTVLATDVRADVVWTVNDVLLNDNATVSGTFTYDAQTDAFSDINITTTSTGFRQGVTYGVRNPYSPGGNQLIALVEAVPPGGDVTGQPSLFLELASPMTDAGGTIDVKPRSVGGSLFGFSFEGTCSDALCSTTGNLRVVVGTTGTVSAVPEPSAFILLSLVGVGVGVVGYLKKRQRK